MKSITLIRHGKSSWKYDVIDRERPLQKRGVDDAKLVANEFVRLKGCVGKIYSSPARRALNTCEIFTELLKISKNEISINEELYDFDGRNVIDFIKKLPNTIDDVMIFGHNHAFTSISNIFGDVLIDNLPTSGLVRLNFEINTWTDLNKGTTEFVIIPKELRK
ncbi:SixA phosphatase family protein [Winogradskyella endarachnes]|uniref:Histidine phosphatase family protein n=1 Tax=Winogradskyella endarachnes TaxID=2681965 RepID=A0A6L6U5A6_9FLAO|nr:histidine phosphatase family protein [Winogradskyella endarachnes]MUU77375.1 histidine phosphatase family protein [Winogradskyella endarachnes]